MGSPEAQRKWKASVAGHGKRGRVEEEEKQVRAEVVRCAEKEESEAGEAREREERYFSGPSGQAEDDEEGEKAPFFKGF